MSILNVSHLSHGYGGRQIFEDVSFRLLKGEHVALVGANGEGKSTFLSIITGQLTPDEGTVEWAKRAKVGYLDQHAVLKAGMTIRDTLRMAFDDMVTAEKEMLAAYDKMGDATPAGGARVGLWDATQDSRRTLHDGCMRVAAALRAHCGADAA